MPSPNPNLIDFPSAPYATTASPSINTSALTQIGDFLLLVVFCATTAIAGPTGPGWTQVFATMPFAGGEVGAWWKISTVNGSEAVPISLAGAQSGCLAVATLRGADNFIQNYSFFESSPANSWAVPPVTMPTNYNGALVVALSTDTVSEAWSLAPSLTQQAFAFEALAGQLVGWYNVQVAAGPSVAYNATKGGAAAAGGVIAFYIPQIPLRLNGPIDSVGGVGLPYTGPGFTATGGTPGYTYAALTPLPPGLALNASTGALTGTFTGVEPTKFTVGVTDAVGQTTSFDAVIFIYATPPPIAPNGPTIVGDLLPDFIGQTTDLDGGLAGGVNIQLPPFKWTDGNTYVAYTNIMTDGSFRQFLAVGRTSKPNVIPFASLDASHAPEVNSNAAPCPVLDLANQRILFLVADGTGDNPPGVTTMSVRVFNLATGKWATPLATSGPMTQTFGTGPFQYNSWFNQVFRQISPTLYGVLYYSPHAGLNPDISFVTVSTGGAWGTPVVVLAAGANLFPYLAGLGAGPGGKTWALYYKGNDPPPTSGRCPLFVNSITAAGALGTEQKILDQIGDNPPARCMGFGTYAPAIDAIIWGFFQKVQFPPLAPPLPAEGCLLKLSGVSGTPTAAFEGVANRPDPGNDDAWNSPDFFISPDGATWYFAVNQIAGNGGPLGFGVESIILFQRPASAPGNWSGPATFYDASANPPGGPVYHNSPDSPTPPAELNSLAFTFIEGQLVTTVGMLSDWCGVIYYLSAGVPAPLLEINLLFCGVIRFMIRDKVGAGD